MAMTKIEAHELWLNIVDNIFYIGDEIDNLSSEDGMENPEEARENLLNKTKTALGDLEKIRFWIERK